MGIMCKQTVTEVRDVEVCAVRIEVPVRYEEEQVPNDFPGRQGDRLTMTWDMINSRRGKIRDWWDRGAFNVVLKVVDEGTYHILGPGDAILRTDTDCYVPHAYVPGSYGDYVELNIQADGTFEYAIPFIFPDEDDDG